MTALERVTSWLRTFPLWEGETLDIDYLGAVPGSAGLFPGGLEEVSWRTDVLGNVMVENRLHFVLCRRTQGQQDNPRCGGWLLELQNWVQQQSAAGLTPKFGDDPGRERIRAEKGKLQSAAQTGTGSYTVDLTVEYVKKY